MRALETRLAKLEAVAPRPVPANRQPIGRLRMKLDEILSDGERFKRLSTKEQVAELRADLRAHQAELRQPGDFVVRGLHEKIVKLNFEDVILGQLHEAEIRLLVQLGHPEAHHPLTPEYREILDLELFDA